MYFVLSQGEKSKKVEARERMQTIEQKVLPHSRIILITFNPQVQLKARNRKRSVHKQIAMEVLPIFHKAHSIADSIIKEF
jgi:hypothetical protein